MGMFLARHRALRGVANQAAYPEGRPTNKWKVDELKAYAEAESIDLADASRKADILTAILQALPEETEDTDKSQEGSESDADDETDASNNPDETSA